MLKIIQHQQKRTPQALNVICNGRLYVVARPSRNTDSQSHFRSHKTALADVLQTHKADPSGELIRHQATQFHGESGLANPAGPRQCENTHAGVDHQIAQLGKLPFTPDKGRPRRWDVFDRYRGRRRVGRARDNGGKLLPQLRAQASW
jgi:hypothetical protein